tara:strand:+ start:2397 stop:5279 length:2883 start_codon:yes stop_codon:yes gene_type:complete
MAQGQQVNIDVVANTKAAKAALNDVRTNLNKLLQTPSAALGLTPEGKKDLTQKVKSTKENLGPRGADIGPGGLGAIQGQMGAINKVLAASGNDAAQGMRDGSRRLIELTKQKIDSTQAALNNEKQHHAKVAGIQKRIEAEVARVGKDRQAIINRQMQSIKLEQQGDQRVSTLTAQTDKQEIAAQLRRITFVNNREAAEAKVIQAETASRTRRFAVANRLDDTMMKASRPLSLRDQGQAHGGLPDLEQSKASLRAGRRLQGMPEGNRMVADSSLEHEMDLLNKHIKELTTTLKQQKTADRLSTKAAGGAALQKAGASTSGTLGDQAKTARNMIVERETGNKLIGQSTVELKKNALAFDAQARAAQNAERKQRVFGFGAIERSFNQQKMMQQVGSAAAGMMLANSVSDAMEGNIMGLGFSLIFLQFSMLPVIAGFATLTFIMKPIIASFKKTRKAAKDIRALAFELRLAGTSGLLMGKGVKDATRLIETFGFESADATEGVSLLIGAGFKPMGDEMVTIAKIAAATNGSMAETSKAIIDLLKPSEFTIGGLDGFRQALGALIPTAIRSTGSLEDLLKADVAWFTSIVGTTNAQERLQKLLGKVTEEWGTLALIEEKLTDDEGKLTEGGEGVNKVLEHTTDMLRILEDAGLDASTALEILESVMGDFEGLEFDAGQGVRQFASAIAGAIGMDANPIDVENMWNNIFSNLPEGTMAKIEKDIRLTLAVKDIEADPELVARTVSKLIIALDQRFAEEPGAKFKGQFTEEEGERVAAIAKDMIEREFADDNQVRVPMKIIQPTPEEWGVHQAELDAQKFSVKIEANTDFLKTSMAEALEEIFIDFGDMFEDNLSKNIEDYKESKPKVNQAVLDGLASLYDPHRADQILNEYGNPTTGPLMRPITTPGAGSGRDHGIIYNTNVSFEHVYGDIPWEILNSIGDHVANAVIQGEQRNITGHNGGGGSGS